MIYFLQRANGDVKIGITVNYPQRIESLKKAHGPLKLLGWHDGYREEEKALHEQFADIRRSGEWFRNHAVLLGYIAEKCETVVDPPSPIVDIDSRLTRQIRVTDEAWKLMKYLAQQNGSNFADVVEGWAQQLYPDAYEIIMRSSNEINAALNCD